MSIQSGKESKQRCTRSPKLRTFCPFVSDFWEESDFQGAGTEHQKTNCLFQHQKTILAKFSQTNWKQFVVRGRGVFQDFLFIFPLHTDLFALTVPNFQGGKHHNLLSRRHCLHFYPGKNNHCLKLNAVWPQGCYGLDGGLTACVPAVTIGGDTQTTPCRLCSADYWADVQISTHSSSGN